VQNLKLSYKPLIHKNRFSFNFKRFAIITVIILSSCLLVFFYSLFNDRLTFNKLSDSLFIDELAANTINMHYTVAYPENFGIEYVPRLSVYVPGEAAALEVELDNMIMSLEGIIPNFLKPDDRYAYELLKSYLLTLKEGRSYHLYEDPLSPGSGAQAMLPILLNDYAFRSVTDVEDYLQILDQVDDYLAGLCAFQREKADAGLFMSDRIADKVIEQCDTIFDKNTILSGEHFLQNSFNERIRALAASGIITIEQMEAFITENNRLLITVVQPAYERTGDELFLLKGSGNNELGLAHFPEGQEYYLHLLASSTGSARNVEEIKQWIFEEFRQNYDELILLLQIHPNLLMQNESTLPFILTTPEEMLFDLEQKIAVDYPSFAVAATGTSSDAELKAASILPTAAYIVKTVSPAMEDYTSPAYYLSPPIDYYWDNTIYINQKNNLSGLSLYTTLAHEGYPGHLYQTVYNRIHMEQNEGNPLRHILHFGGYQEGWALYVEMEAFDFAKELMFDSGLDIDYLYDYYRLNHALLLGLYSLLDIAIHYDGADALQVRKILANVGIIDADASMSIFDYIVSEPGNYPKYYLGYLEILALKEEAKVAWGDKYSDYEFHRAFLEAGPSDFGALRKLLIK
jgi:uncharacterized protein (DUF885 family)